jgi:hypothetical protein
VIESDGRPVACAWLYLDAAGSGCAWLAWLCTDPGAVPIVAGRALKHAECLLCEIASMLGYRVMVATLAGESWGQFMQSCGWRAGDRGLAHWFKPLSDQHHGT